MENLPNLPPLGYEIELDRLNTMAVRLAAQAHDIWDLGLCTLSEYEQWSDKFHDWHAFSKQMYSI